MPGKKSSINKGFRSIFHIPEVKRGPTRERVTALKERAHKLTRTPAVMEIIALLEQAARAAFDKLKVNDDDGRAKSVQKAEGICDQIMNALIEEETKAKSAPKETVVLKTTTAMDGSVAIIKGFKDRVAAVDKSIELMTKPPGDLKRVLMPKDAWAAVSLTGQAQGARLQIDAQVIDSARQKVLETQVSALEVTMTAALDYIVEARKQPAVLEAPGAVIGRALALKQKFEDAKMPGLDQLPFVLQIGKIRDALYRAAILNPLAIDKMADDLEKMLVAAESDTDTYVANALEGGNRDRVEKLAYNEIVLTHLEKLRQLAEPLNLPDYLQCSADASKDRALLMDLKRPCPAGEGARLGRIRETEIKKALVSAGEEALRVRNEATTTRDALLLEIEKIKATREVAVFTMDWKSIDAGLVAINALMPAKDATIEAAIAAAHSVVVLVTQLKARVAQVDKQKGDAALFEKKVADLRTEMKAAVGDKGAIRLWDKASGTELTERRHQLNKELKTLTAEVALERLADIRKDFDAKIAVVKPIDDYAKSVEADMQGWFVLYGFAISGMDGPAPDAPNAMLAAVDSWTAACKLRPPVKADLEKAYKACQTAFKDVGTRGIADIAGDTHTQLAAEEKDKKTAEKAMRDKLNARRYGLAGQAKAARKTVEKVKGDETQLKRIDELLETVKEHIKAGDEAAATRTMNIISNRIGLVQGNPAGEPTRRRKELETLFQEWVDTTTKARQNLGEVVKLVDDYADSSPSGAIAGQVKQLSKAILDYQATFTTPPGSLRTAFELLADPGTPDSGRRAARETALAYVTDSINRLKAHPLTTELARSPVPAARLVPGLLVRTLDRMNFTVSIAVE